MKDLVLNLSYSRNSTEVNNLLFKKFQNAKSLLIDSSYNLPSENPLFNNSNF